MVARAQGTDNQQRVDQGLLRNDAGCYPNDIGPQVTVKDRDARCGRMRQARFLVDRRQRPQVLGFWVDDAATRQIRLGSWEARSETALRVVSTSRVGALEEGPSGVPWSWLLAVAERKPVRTKPGTGAVDELSARCGAAER
ncbi:hypothetical protein M8818_004654 [Zalaria obscura]|uniref:Uncharacterized protein n=1 Tax=Zalaria obscura TaxID=2024903 RepID=A0ACC3SCL7_9PEZI